MQEAGVNMVSVGIFSWALLEPEPGVYDFAWLDRVVELLWSHGVSISLATPSAAPPAWLVRRHPEILPVTAEGVRLEFGSRRHACPSSPVFREATVRIAEQLATHYGEHPALALWHVSNEFGCHLPACYCAVSAEHFRRWLRERYGEVPELNRAWGTAFWGQRYGDWSEIEPPRLTPTSVNPTQALDWARFCSDALYECFDAERNALARIAPQVPITTNFMSAFKPVDYWKWARNEDLVTLDSYPDPADEDAHVLAALNYDLMRSLAGSRPWLLLEHATSAVNWRPVNLPKRPGLMRLWAHQALARGSDGVMFFQWRASRAGAEKFHSAMVPHTGRDSRVWEDVVGLGSELAALEELAGSTSDASVALLFDWDNWWALEAPDHPSQRLRLWELLLEGYRPLFDQNIAVELAHPADDLAGYRLVVAPNLYLAGSRAVAALEAFVEGGGVLVLGCFSGVVDENDHARLDAADAGFRRLRGARVDEYWPLADGEEASVSLAGGSRVPVSDWCEWIEPEGAEVLASYESGPLMGRPAVLRNRVGKGVVYSSSARLGAGGWAELLAPALEEAGVEPVGRATRGVELCRRSSDETSYLFVLNHTDEEVIVEGPRGVDLLTGGTLDGLVRLGPLGVAVVREAPRRG